MNALTVGTATGIQATLLGIGQGLMEDVREAGDDQSLLEYAAGRAQRRLRTALGKQNPDTEVLRGLVQKARIKDVHEVVGIMDEVGLSMAG